jgi:hypothetical protein
MLSPNAEHFDDVYSSAIVVFIGYLMKSSRRDGFGQLGSLGFKRAMQ